MVARSDEVVDVTFLLQDVGGKGICESGGGGSEVGFEVMWYGKEAAVNKGVHAIYFEIS